jgi:hypothetical protein
MQLGLLVHFAYQHYIVCESKPESDPEAPTGGDCLISCADGIQIMKDSRCNVKRKECSGSPNAGNNPTTARTFELWMNI